MRRGVRSSNHDRPLPTEEMHGSDRVPDLRDYERAWWVGKGKPSTRAKWRSSRSACCSALENRLTPPTLSERRCYANNWIASDLPGNAGKCGLQPFSCANGNRRGGGPRISLMSELQRLHLALRNAIFP